MTINIHISGRGYHLAQHIPPSLELADGAPVSAAMSKIRTLLPAGQALSDSSLVIHSGRHLGTVARFDDAILNDGDELLLLAPVAGG